MVEVAIFKWNFYISTSSAWKITVQFPWIVSEMYGLLKPAIGKSFWVNCLVLVFQSNEMTYLGIYWCYYVCSSSRRRWRLRSRRWSDGVNAAKLDATCVRERIFQLMRETFAARRRWMKDNNPAVQTILSRYPRFSDVPGFVSSSSDCSNCIYFT